MEGLQLYFLKYNFKVQLMEGLLLECGIKSEYVAV